MLVDSHCHLNLLDLSAFDGKMENLIAHAKSMGVAHILCVGVDLDTAQTVIDIANQYDGVSASVGVHPSEKLAQEPDENVLLTFAQQKNVIAIGETGLDYYYNESGLDVMRERFRLHIRIAKQLQKPLIIHTRSAQEDTLCIMREEDAGVVGGVMHCFTESLDMAKAAMDLGFYISFSGIVTFKNAINVAEVARHVPLSKMLIETDAPYLTPVPYRGKPNYPHYVRFVAEKIAEIKGESVENVIKVTGQNFVDCFRA